MSDNSSAPSSFADWKAYAYNPSTAAAVIFAILFGVITIVHTYHLFRTRTWFFIPFVIGGYFETVGYVGRLISSTQSPDWTLTPYIMQSTLLLVAPALIAASIYMELGRIITLAHGDQYSIIRPAWLTKIFVGGDILSFLMQSSGAGIMVKKDTTGDNQKMGNNIILGGLVVQILFFGFFMLCAVIFQRRIAHRPASQDSTILPWKRHMNALYISSLLILVRSLFRVVEYAQGHDGYLLSTEVWLYIFDACLMWLVFVVFLKWHPSEINALLGRGERVVAKGGLIVSQFTVAV